MVEISDPAARENDDVEWWQSLLFQPETLANEPLEAVAMPGERTHLAPDDDAEPGMRQGIFACQQENFAGGEALRRTIEDRAELRRLEQAYAFRKARACHTWTQRSALSGRQALAAPGPATLEYQATVAGRHAGAESVRTLALEIAWLEGSFHVCAVLGGAGAPQVAKKGRNSS